METGKASDDLIVANLELAFQTRGMEKEQMSSQVKESTIYFSLCDINT